MSLSPLLLLAAVIAAEPDYELEIKPSQRVTAVLTTKLEGPKLKASEWIFYVARPPSITGQEVHNATLLPDGRASRELSSSRRSVLFARVTVQPNQPQNAIEFTSKFDVTLKSRKLVRRKPGQKPTSVNAISPEEKKLALATSAEYDFENRGFREWLVEHKLNRKTDETELDYARRVFLFIKSNFQYEYTATLDRKASFVCRHGRSDCGGLSELFVAIMRSNSIPARTLVGRWAMSQEPGQKVSGIAYAQQHAKAEFFAEGVGWVPVDLASAVLYDKTAEGLTYFGNDDGDFLVMHIDGGLILDSIHFGKAPVEVLQGGAVWVKGSGSMEGFTQTEHWDVKKMPR